MTWLRIAFFVMGLSATLVAIPISASAAEWFTILRDDFDGDNLDLQIWRVYTEGKVSSSGFYLVEDGLLKMRSNVGFPSLVIREGIVPEYGDLKFTFRFRYVHDTNLGTRIVAAALGHGVEGCANDPEEFAVYGFHEDDRGSNAFAYPWQPYTGCGLGPAVPFDYPHQTYHVGELVFAADGVTLSVDGEVLQVAEGEFPRPNTVFLGWGSQSGQFTEYDVDYIEISVLDGPVQTREKTWGEVKSHYR